MPKYLLKVAIFPTACIWRSHWGDQLEFHQRLWCQKTSPCAVIRPFNRTLACDRQMDGQTQDAMLSLYSKYGKWCKWWL